ncbi:glycosyltransferase family 4 protein [Primorskyibacter aestuariivivens]|uniref:glycosyltransferase family 4 protein n=1 Tax=Primorskyibacter aestuariivivens TaxID=1888912 RepID=UPI002300122E|nr:glycosyltransferase family 4 protein [Primorskyibacter aestuariivivens]MDA7429632.1 glycosyltransferase family 4 protein [Primorskyibacter aestuariivivens]
MTSDPQRRFAFVVNADVPIASWSVLAELQRCFPAHQVDLFNTANALRADRGALARCAAEALVTYPGDIVLRRKRLRDALFRTRSVARFVQGHLHDMVHPDTHDFVFQMQSLWSARVPGLPHFLYTDHTNLTHRTYPDTDPGALYNADFLAREAEIYRNATTVFTRSENIRRSVVDDYGADPTRVDCVYAGANTETPETQVTNQQHAPDILFVGMDWARKGGPDLVRAYRDVLKAHPDATLTIVGCTPDGLPDLPGLRVMGRQDKAQLIAHYNAASVFCMPTLREPFGIAFIEAMAFGLPVIGTNLGAIPDFIHPGETGCLVEPGCSDQIADALLRLLGDPARAAAMGRRGQQLAQERYNWPAVVSRMAAHIRPALQRGAARSR